jgi:UDP-N-acetylmuramyl tripeptide synthase
MQLSLDEVRRLTGPNLLSDYPGAIADVFIDGLDSMSVVQCWQRHLHSVEQIIGWQQQQFFRLYDGGASLSISAPMDLLYSACDAVELAWDLCVDELSNTQNVDKQSRIQSLLDSVRDEANPALIELLSAAEKNDVVCLADDDEISLGMGVHSTTWPISEMPDANSVDWQLYKKVPLAFVTGTNGKSTSVRLAAEIAKAAGVQAGVTSTDFIKVGDTIIDEGDYSGPGGARMLLRDKRTETAFLETARGGLLRRGLPTPKADAALITNVASDHLGQYGINTVDEIAHVKLMVAKAIDENRTLVLNADDKRLVKFVPEFFPDLVKRNVDLPICWFSTNINNPLIQSHINKSLPCAYSDNGELVYHHGKAQAIANIKDVPMTVNGTAQHNIENALGVIGLCKALGFSDTAIVQGLHAFSSDANDNPGRGNIYDVNGVTTIIDFAHNAHSVKAVMNMAKKMSDDLDKDSAIHVMFSHGGDRSNKDILDLTNEVIQLQPSTYILAELEVYLRGRELNEISDLVEAHLKQHGVDSSQIVRAIDSFTGVKKALAKSKEGDLLLLFVLSQREEIQAYLDSL